MKKQLIRKLAATFLVAAGCALASEAAVAAPTSETLTAVFTTPDGGVTVNGYDGWVRLDVSGVGQSLGSCFNDAFYLYTCGIAHDGSFYQLTFGTTTLVALNPAQDAFHFIDGGLPAYNPSHNYVFFLNTGVFSPTLLHFGVSDGVFRDNSGAYTINVTEIGVPEPGVLALIAAGLLSLFGFGLIRRRADV